MAEEYSSWRSETIVTIVLSKKIKHKINEKKKATIKSSRFDEQKISFESSLHNNSVQQRRETRTVIKTRKPLGNAPHGFLYSYFFFFHKKTK